MASQPGPLYDWPWPESPIKFSLFVPFVAVLVMGWDDKDNWCLHMLLIAGLRYLLAQAWSTASRFHAISAKTRIYGRGVDFKQVDRETHWDNYIILQAIIMTIVHKLPYLEFHSFPLMNWGGMLQLLMLHVGPTEFIYYWLHRALHWHPLYQRYHSHHHASFVTEPITGSVHPFAEHVVYTANFALPLLGTFFAGGASWAMFYVYLLGFDCLNAIGHCNFEFFPRLYLKVPLLKYLIYTPTFHSLHHSQVKTNFCLFMPLYDYVYGTADPASDELFAKAREGLAVPDRVPESVFIGHGTEVLSVWHVPFVFRGFTAHPYYATLWMYLLWPLTLPIVLGMWLWGSVFVADKHSIGDMPVETWCMPALGYEYFLKFRWPKLNARIRAAIEQADAAGVRVVGLGALNKNEALNGGGKLFVDTMPELKVRVVHGNTLTAAAILRKVPAEAKEVFITGATSKLGRALALYLSARGVRVLMLTQSEARFEGIASEAATPEQRALLVKVGSIKEARECTQWLVGKHLSVAEQNVAPPGTTFHVFVVPPIKPVRKDCLYTPLPAFELPKSARGFRSCEMTMPRRCVHACHAGALLHALERWEHHEVGAIDHTRIDAVWEASKIHGFRLI